jgi:transcriptional regulator with XRE-family HTH domain
MTSATLIQQARRRAGLTQSELAGRVGTTQSAIARWERGSTHPTVERLQSLVEACGLELRLGLGEPSSDELAALRRNLALSVDARVQRIVQLHHFIAAGRAAIARVHAEQ